MAVTTFQVPISGLDSIWGGTSVSGETHYIPRTSPYTILLNRVPKVKSTGTNVLDNDYVSLADMASAGISLTIGGVAATLVSSSTPSAGEVYFQIIDSTYNFSPKMVFNSADLGKAVVVNYTGYMSNLAGQYILELQAALERLEEYPACALLSYNEYSGGRFDDTVADTTGIYVLGSRGDLQFVTGRYAFTTTSIDFTTGNTQVSGFTDVDGYKQIGVWLIDNSGTVEARITEGVEAATSGATTAPPDYAGDAILCGIVIVQGDGTGAAGGIEDVAQTSITMSTLATMSSQLSRIPFVYEWIDNSDPLTTGTDKAGPWWPEFDGVIESLTLALSDTGSGGSNAVVDCNISGTSIYSVSGTKPTVTANSGTYQKNTSTDMGTTTFSDTDYLTIDYDTVPTAADTARIIIRGYRTT